MAKKQRYLLTLVTCLVVAACWANEADKLLLPNNFKVYYKENVGVINHPQTGFNERVLPTINAHQGEPGCYIACYSHHQDQSVYPVAKDIFVMGQIRVPGHYEGRICLPQGFEKQDISAAVEFKAKCEAYLPSACRERQCWAGGDTGGWFGVQ